MYTPSIHIGRAIVAVGLVGLLAACSDRRAILEPPGGPSFATAADQGEITETDLHLVLMQDAIPANFSEQVIARGGTVATTLAQIGLVVTRGLTDAAAAQLARAPGVLWVERDISVQWAPSPSDAAVTMDRDSVAGTNQSGAESFAVWQWNLRQVAADDAWDVTNGGAGTKVAILDTGIDPFHLDLAGKVDLANSASTLLFSPCGPFDQFTIFDLHWHGSFVGGIVSSNGIRFASVAPDAQLMAVKVLACNGFGSFSGILAGIVHATDHGADVINMSIQGGFPKRLRGINRFVSAFNRATNYANLNGVLVVAAAGNFAQNLDRDRDFIALPAQAANVISVSATGPVNQLNFDQLAFYSNFGFSGVTLAAPGGNRQPGGSILDGIRSACSSFSIVFPPCAVGFVNLVGANGTSFAAPHVAGAAAVVKSDDLTRGPSQLEHCILKRADDLGQPGTDLTYSHGRLNVLGAAAC